MDSSLLPSIFTKALKVSEKEQKIQLIDVFIKAFEETEDDKHKCLFINHFPVILETAVGERREELLNLFKKAWEEKNTKDKWVKS